MLEHGMLDQKISEFPAAPGVWVGGEVLTYDLEISERNGWDFSNWEEG